MTEENTTTDEKRAQRLAAQGLPKDSKIPEDKLAKLEGRGGDPVTGGLEKRPQQAAAGMEHR